MTRTDADLPHFGLSSTDSDGSTCRARNICRGWSSGVSALVLETVQDRGVIARRLLFLCGSEVSGVATRGQNSRESAASSGLIVEPWFVLDRLTFTYDVRPWCAPPPTASVEPMPAIDEDRSTSDPAVRAGFVVWARIWSVVFAVMFVGVTALTIGLWLTDPEYTETTPVSDLSFFALGAIIGLGFVSQLRTPQHNIAGVQQAIIGSISLGGGGADRRPD